MKARTVGIIGTGPASLMAGTILLEDGCNVVFFEAKKSPARKFLVAGNGGFNLTNTVDTTLFEAQYDHVFLKDAIRAFDHADFRTFLAKIGVETYVGSSGKVFPIAGTKPIVVLTKWLDYLRNLGAVFHFSSPLIAWEETGLVFEQRNEKVQLSFDAVVFALGGASWAKTGSCGSWTSIFQKRGIDCLPFQASNSGVNCLNWSGCMKAEGGWLKNCVVYSGDLRKKGDVLLTHYGLEGAPIYALNACFRDNKQVYLDLKPDLSLAQINAILNKAKTNSEGLRDLKLAPASRFLVKEFLSKEAFLAKDILASTIKKWEIPYVSLRPLEEVISTIGGLEMREIDAKFQLKKYPNNFCVGEMLNWDAPTGGYLIQGAVSSGYVAAMEILKALR